MSADIPARIRELEKQLAEEKAKVPKWDHPSHKTRYSDSSFYDEVCTVCGATDGRGDYGLKYPCPGVANAETRGEE